jgi:polyribonucleotide nucleotidyltransferase
MKKIFETNFAGKKLIIETGSLARRANGSVLVKYGDSIVLTAVTASKEPKKGLDFFPLSVEYSEKTYADPNNFPNVSKRSGKPSDKEVLIRRAIDRGIRPLFPEGFKNEVNVNNMVLKKGEETSSQLAAMLGTAAALAISDVPFNGPIASVNIGMKGDKIAINPSPKMLKESDLALVLSGKKDKITMIEAKANEVSEDKMLTAIMEGQKEINKIVHFIENMKKEIGKPKFEFSKENPFKTPKGLADAFKEKLREVLYIDDNQKRNDKLEKVEKEFIIKFTDYYSKKYPNIDLESIGREEHNKIKKETIRKLLLKEGRRIDGRKVNEVRNLFGEVGVLPHTHGSAVFERGETQVLSTVTLGPSRGRDNFVHYYNFPGFSTGEAKTTRATSARELGHGALVIKAIEPVLPNSKEFPYSVAAISEVLASNGSSSQASICGTTLALLDAGVPLKAPVAGIAAGLVSEKNNIDNHVTLLDLQGIEDAYGDMDFKVAGTKNGITAIQMDTKIDGLNKTVIKEALEITKKGRHQILDQVITKLVPEGKTKIPTNIPKVTEIAIDPKKKGLVIGKKGATIKRISSESNTKIEVKEDGKVLIYSNNEVDIKKAIKLINEVVGIDKKPELTNNIQKASQQINNGIKRNGRKIAFTGKRKNKMERQMQHKLMTKSNNKQKQVAM